MTVSNSQPRPPLLLGLLLLCRTCPVVQLILCWSYVVQTFEGTVPWWMTNWCMWGKYQDSEGSNLLPHLHLLCQSLLMAGFQYRAIYLQFQKSKYCINDIFNWAMNLADTVLYIIGHKNILMLILSATNHIVKLCLTSLFSSSLVPTVGTFGDLITVVETLRHCQDACCAYTTPITAFSCCTLISKSLWFIH